MCCKVQEGDAGGGRVIRRGKGIIKEGIWVGERERVRRKGEGEGNGGEGEGKG